MDGLDHNWKRHLDSPLDGRKDRISRFHAYDCYQSVGEFTGWTRTETDYFRHQLRTVISESDVAAYGIACSGIAQGPNGVTCRFEVRDNRTFGNFSLEAIRRQPGIG